MSDVFHGHFTLAMIRQVFDVIEEASWHQFQVLTKRPERAVRLAKSLPWPRNLWLGTSIENMQVKSRVDALRRTPAAVRFISAEPLLGSLYGLDISGIHWVIGGGESGPNARPVDPTWAIELRDMCRGAAVPFFWKQWGGRTPKANGRLLAGEFWDQYPEPRVAAT